MASTTVLPPADYVVRKDVFVLDPHTLRDKSGKTVVDVTEPMLAKIAANQNKRINETGDATPLVIGHTRDGEREGDGPEVVGYATDWKLTRFYKTGKRALSCTFHIFKKAADKVRKFPRRSVELWLDSLTIDPISLLGATTPQRDLGLLRLSKAEGSKLVATRDDTGELTVDENTQQIVDAVLEAIKSTDVWQFMTKKMDEEGSEAESSANAGDESPLGGEGASGGEFDPQGQQGLLDALGGGADAGGAPGGDDEALQMAAGAPGGGNTFAPGMDAEKPNRYSKINFQKMMRENEDMKSTLNALLIRYQRAEREKDLIQLESEGYMLDRDEELNLCTNLDNEQFKQHLQRVRLRYQRVPMGSAGVLEHSANVNRGRTMDDVKMVAEYARNNGLSYESALERLNGSNKVTY